MTLTKNLEERGNEVRSHIDLEARPTPRSLLELQIALLSEQIERARDFHDSQLHNILEAECYVGTDLLKLDCYDPRVYAARFKVRDNLKNKLLKLSMERRRLSAAHEQDIRDLHGKLLDALSKLNQLDF